MIMSLAAFTALALSCAPGVASETLAAIARTESSFETLAIHDNTSRDSYSPADKSAAIALARQLLDQGHSIDVGLMQINSGNWKWLGLSLDDAVEPCPSLRAGAAVLTAYSRYNTGSPARGFVNGYVARVVSASQQLPRLAAAAVNQPAPPESSPASRTPFAGPARTMPEMVFWSPRR